MKQLLLIFFMAILAISHGQKIKIKNATQQKTFAGMGGIFMNYLIELRFSNSLPVEIDSVKTVADATPVQFIFFKDTKKISFGFALVHPEKCRTCPDTDAQPVNTTKGVIIYGTARDKNFLLYVKKFRQLPDLRTP